VLNDASGIQTETVHPPAARNRTYHHLGQAILALNKVRHEIQGYRTPRPFPVTEIDNVIGYDYDVVRKLMDAYRAYTGRDVSLEGRNVLELGPGPDLGVGLIMLARGAKAYHAIDVNDLVKSAPDALYDALFTRFEREGVTDEVIGALREQLRMAREGRGDRLDYVCRKDFDIRVFAGKGIDLVVSHAAFEHFDAVDQVIGQAAEVTSQGALFLAEVDLQTHTRWIRDSDPLNIYRYSPWMYRFFKFLGSPNRVRPYEYKESLARHGWTDIRMHPAMVVDADHLSRVRGSLNQQFRDERNEMQILKLVVCATRGR
jgi:hypothetical protein